MSLKNLLLSLALVALPAVTQAAEAPQKTIVDGAERVRELLRQKVKKNSPAEKEQKRKLKAVVDGFLDYRELAQRALGPHWKDRTPQEQEEFTSLLRDLIEASYTNGIRDNIEFTLRIEDETLSEDGIDASVVAVASAHTKKGKPVSEDLTFHLLLKDRHWLIYDVEFGEDLSLVRHYRGEFNRKIKKESYSALVGTMKQKLAEIRSGKLERDIKL